MSETRTAPPTPTEGDRLLNEPIVIEHPPGRQIELVFTNGRMVGVERIFGSMRQFEIELNEVLRRGARAPILSFTVRALDALLPDDPLAIRDNRADALELDKLGDVVEAIRQAWSQFWPVPDKASANPNSAGAESAPSIGPTGTTSRSSVAESTRNGSGT